jgi:hypothetical protein
MILELREGTTSSRAVKPFVISIGTAGSSALPDLETELQIFSATC